MSAAPEFRCVLIASLRPPAENPRTIAACELAELRRSIRRFGVVEPVIARAGDLGLIAGRQRLAAAAAEGLAEVPAVLVECSDADARVLAIALNKTGGTWDVPALAEMIRDLSAAGVDLRATGFDRREIERLRGG